MSSARILIVEADAGLRRLLRCGLEEDGLDVDIVAIGMELLVLSGTASPAPCARLERFVANALVDLTRPALPTLGG